MASSHLVFSSGLTCGGSLYSRGSVRALCSPSIQFVASYVGADSAERPAVPAVGWFWAELLSGLLHALLSHWLQLSSQFVWL